MARPDPNDLVGTLVGGRYRLEQLVGRGGFAWVYRASTPSGLDVAFKRLHNGDSSAILRFARETQVLKALPSTPFVASYIDGGQTDDGWPFLVLEYVAGISLKAGMERHPMLEPRKAVTFMAVLCEALAGLHRLGVAHRDVKPDNILLARQGGIKLIDFGLIRDAQGILKLLEQVDPVESRVFQDELDRRILVGTPEYMAPEQFSDANMDTLEKAHTDTWSDVFSLGVIFYQILTGRLPFPMKKVSAQQFPKEFLRYMGWRMKLTNEAYPPCPGIDGELETILRKALRQDPRHRQHDARILKHDLTHYLRTGQGVPLDAMTRTINIDMREGDQQLHALKFVDSLGPTTIASAEDDARPSDFVEKTPVTSAFICAETIPDTRPDPTEPQETALWLDVPTIVDDASTDNAVTTRNPIEETPNPFEDEEWEANVFSSVDPDDTQQ